MNIKPQPNHQLYLQALKRMTAGERLKKVFKLSDIEKKLFLSGLKKRFPEKTEAEIMSIYIDILKQRSKEKSLINNGK